MKGTVRTSRTVLVIGSAIVAGGASGGNASAQDAEAPLGFPTCVVDDENNCRLPDGHPDLTGQWRGANVLAFGGGGGRIGSGLEFQNFAGRGGAFNFETDGALWRESSAASVDASKPSWPMYKPEHWDVVTDNNYNGNFLDPLQHCLPNVIPRVGAPHGIIGLPGQPFVALLYSDPSSFGIKSRIVPTDGREHHTENVASERWSGDPVGHWEGDTLVVETIGFSDQTWLHKNGFIHGFNMKVTERFTRTDNTLLYEVTVEDPEYFMEPWVLPATTLNLVTEPGSIVPEQMPCIERDIQQTTSHARSG
jgi:hypothetical protein